MMIQVAGVEIWKIFLNNCFEAICNLSTNFVWHTFKFVKKLDAYISLFFQDWRWKLRLGSVVVLVFCLQGVKNQVVR